MRGCEGLLGAVSGCEGLWVAVRNYEGCEGL